MSLYTRHLSAGSVALPRFQLNRLSTALCSCLIFTFSSASYSTDWPFDRNSKWPHPGAPIIGGDHVTISNGATLTFDFVNDLEATSINNGAALVITTHYDDTDKAPSADVLIEGNGKIYALAKSVGKDSYGIANDIRCSTPERTIRIRGIDLEFKNFYSGIYLPAAGKTEITDSNILISLQEGEFENPDTVGIYTMSEGNSLTISGKSSVAIRNYLFGLYVGEGSVSKIFGNQVDITHNRNEGKRAVAVHDNDALLAMTTKTLNISGYRYGFSALNSKGMDIHADTLSIADVVFGIVASESSIDTEVFNKLNLTATSNSIYAGNGSSIKINAEKTKQSEVKGDITARHKGTTLYANFGESAKVSAVNYSYDDAKLDLILGVDSVLDGAAWNFSERHPADSDKDPKRRGELNIALGKNATWNLTDSSLTDTLKVDESHIHLDRGSSSQVAVDKRFFTKLKADTLVGDNSTFYINTDLAQDKQGHLATDQLTVTNGSATDATHHLAVNLLSDGKKGQKRSANPLVIQTKDSGSNLTFALKDGYVSANGSVKRWGMAFEPTTGAGAGETQTSQGQAGGWYLVLDPKSDPDNYETNGAKNTGTSYASYLSWRSELSDLRHRLGEVHNGVSDGLWVKSIYDKERASGLEGKGFRQETTGFHFGGDKHVGTNSYGDWLIGGALRFAYSEQRHMASAKNGDGELEQYSAKVYATAIAENGFYTDMVLSLGYYEQEMSGLSNQQDCISKASYDTFGFGFSTEIGRQFVHRDRDNPLVQWFAEPQLQLSYYRIKGRDWITTTAMRVSQESVDFLTGRMGVVLGRKVTYGADDTHWYQLALRAGATHEFLGKQTVTINGEYRFDADIGSTTMYCGFEADWQFVRNQRFYLNVDQETGHRYRKDISLRFGYRYSF